jgi:D-amino peptidase
MKVYIMTDMEGVAGVLNSDDYAAPGARYYETGRDLTTCETNAAIEAALEAGAEDILVVDGHGHGAINPLMLHPRARLLAGRPIGYPFGCDASFDAAMMIGQHAKSNTDGGHLSHTGSFGVEDLAINGRSIGEMGCNMLFAGHFGVPTVFVSGDAAASEEARALVPDIGTAAVKEGVRRGPATGLTAEENKRHNGAAIHLHPDQARALIQDGVREALSRRHEIEPFRLAPPCELISVLRKSAEAPQRKAVVRADDVLQLLTASRTYE